MLQRVTVCQVLLLRVSSQDFGGDLRRDTDRMFISFPGVPFQGRGLHFLVSTRAGRADGSVWLLLKSAMALLVRFCCFPGPGAETHLRPRCISFGSEPQCPGGLMLKGYSLAPWFVPPLRGSQPHGQQCARGGKVMILVFPVLPFAGPALLRPNCPPRVPCIFIC